MDHYNLDHLLGDCPKENAVPAGPRNGAENLAAGKIACSKDSAFVAIGQALDRPLEVTRFPDVKARDMRSRSLSLRTLAKAIRQERASEKKALPLLKLGTFGDARTAGGALRHDANLLTVSGIEGDYDAGVVSPEEGAARLKAAGVAALIYTTPSHTTDKPRWRVLSPLSAPVTPAERDDLCARLNGALGGILAGESFARSQTYYYGGVGGEPVMHLVEGRFLDAAEDVQPIGKAAAEVAAPAKKDESRSAKAFKLAGQFKRAGESFDDFADACRADATLADWAKDDRQLRRAWDRARDLPTFDASDFGDLPDALVADFPLDELPDLSHDQLALDLGRDSFDANGRYVGELGGWLLWEGTRWQASTGMRPMGIVRAYVRAKASALMRWAEASGKSRNLDAEALKDLIADTRRQAKAMRQDPFIAAVERLARSNHCSLSRPEDWDAEDMLLGTPGGTVDLRTGELRPADRGDHITKNTQVAPADGDTVPKAACRRLAEAGCTPHEIMAISGHASLSEVTRYTVAAGKKNLASRAMAALQNKPQLSNA